MWFRMFYYDLYLHFIHIVQNQYIKDVLFNLKQKFSNIYGNHLGTVSAFEYQTPYNKCGELVFTHMQLSLVGWTRPLSLPLLLLRCFQDRFLAPRLRVKFDFLFSGQDISVPQHFRRSVHYISTCYSNGTLLWYFQLWGSSETNVLVLLCRQGAKFDAVLCLLVRPINNPPIYTLRADFVRYKCEGDKNKTVLSFVQSVIFEIP